MSKAELEQASAAQGTTPAGATDEQSAARAVQKMFDEIAPRYDLANHTLSINVDRIWWRRTARIFIHILQRPNSIILDLCAGTGDMAVALHTLAAKKSSNPSIYALDFSHQMLSHGLNKYSARGISAVKPMRSRCPSQIVWICFSAFGFRNLANYDAGLRHLRVLQTRRE